MTAWNQWAQNALVMNLGWTLLAFVWQGAVIGLAAGLQLKLLQHRSPDVRYAVSLGCLLVAIACPFATFFAMQSSVSRVDHELSPVPSPEVISRVESQPSTRKLAVNVARQESSSIDRPQANVADPATTSPKTAFAFNLPPRFPGAAVGLWMAGVVFLAVRLAGVWWLTRRTLCRSTLPLRGEWVRIAERLARQIGVHRAVRWLESASIDVPLTVGWLWPVVVVPTSILSGLSPAEIECLLAHELVHVRRHDYIVNLLQTGAEILLFYHPVVWWLSRQIRHERELICDARAAATMGDPLVYSRALLKVATLAGPPTPALAATGGILQQRIAILLGIAPHRGCTSGWLVVGLVATLLIGGISCALFIMPDRDVDASSHLVADAEDQGGIPSVRLIKGQHSIGPVSGRVRTPKGEPVAGAQVWIRERTTRRQSWGKLPGRPAQTADLARTTTDADGRYSFAVVPLPSDTGDSVWLDVVVQATEHAIGWKHFDFPRDAQNADVVLRTPHAITGQIVDQAGIPIARAVVRVQHLMSIRHVAQADLETDRWPRIDDPKFVDLAWFSEAPTAITDAAGRFELSALPPDSGVVIDVVHPRFVVANVFAATVGELDSVNAAHLKRPVQTGAVKVVLAPGRTLNVHVVFDDTGGAAVGARYTLPPIVHPPSRTVGLDGSFALTSLHVSNVDLFVYPPVGSDYLAQSQTIEFPADVYEMEHTIRLVRGAIVSGKVVDSVTSAGIAHARLIPAGAFLPHGEAHYSREDYPIKTAADGSFRAAVVPGNVRLWVQGPLRGYRTAQLPAGASILDMQAGTLVTTSLDQPVEGIVIPLQPAPVVRGTVVDSQGQTTAGVAISTKLEGAWSWDKLWRSDDAGRFRLDDLYSDIADEAEPIPVVFHDSSSNSGTIVWLDPPADELNREIEVQLQPLGKLIGRIIDDDTGRPVAGKHLLATFFGGSATDAVAAILNISAEDMTDDDLQRMEKMIDQARQEAEPEAAVESATATAETAPIESHPTELAAATEAKREPETDDGAIVRGRVLDPDGQPVPGAKLQLIANPFSRASEEDAAPVDLTATDGSGEFEFHYEPDEFYGSAGELLLVTAEGLAPHWQPAETFTGRVTDANGKPVSASIGYWPTFPNANLRPGIGGGEANVVGAYSDSPTDRNGEFAAIVLPGPGFLGIRASDRDAYESANVDANTFFKEHGVPYFSTVDASNVTYPFLITSISDTVSSVMPQSNFHAIELLNVDPGVEEPAREITLRPVGADGRAVNGRETPTVVASENTEPATTATSRPMNIRGTVVDPDGKPVAGATIHIVNFRCHPETGATLSARVVSTLSASSSGDFEIELPQVPATSPTAGSEFYQAAVTAPGFGFGVARQYAPESEPIKVQLPPAQSISGRIIDLEGRPIPGATIRVVDIAMGASSGAVDEWLDVVRDAPPIRNDQQTGHSPPGIENTRFPGMEYPQFATCVFPTLMTDTEGRFQLDGIGRDRVAGLLLTGPGLAQTLIHVLTRPLDKPVHAQSVNSFGTQNMIYGSDFTFIAGPSAPVTGVVRDADTHSPIADATVMSEFVRVGPDVYQQGFISTKTDANGRYELNGLPFGKGHTLVVAPGENPYLITEALTVHEIRDLQGVVRDIELPRAVWATGRLFDETTGEPVQGTLHYSPFQGNPFAERYPQYADQSTYLIGADADFHTDADGRFRIPVIPGPGVLCAKADGEGYRTSYGAEKIEKLAPFINRANQGRAPTYDYVTPSMFHALREITPAADAAEISVDLPVDPGISLELVFADAAGQPVADVIVRGVTLSDGYKTSVDHATAIGLTDGTAVTVEALQRERKLGARIDITPTRDSGPQTIVLHRLTTVRGRLIDPQGVPVTDIEIEIRSSSANGLINGMSHVDRHEKGEFVVELLPGGKYQLLSRNEKYTILAKDLAANPGEAVDLGDLVIDPDGKNWGDATPKRPPIVTKSQTSAESKLADPDKPLSTAPSASSSPSKPGAMQRPVAGGSTAAVARADAKAAEAAPSDREAAEAITIGGTVVDPAGKPVAGAIVRAQTPLWAMLEPLVPPGSKPPVVESQSGQNGEFKISFSTQPFGDLSGLNPQWADIWKKTVIAASVKGFGPAWVAYEEIKQPEQPVTLKVVEDLPIEGRIVNLEGAPLAGETIKISDLRGAENEDLSPWLAAITAGEPPWTAWKKSSKSIDPKLVGIPETVTSDADGRFEIRGLGRERVLALTFESDVVSHKNVQVATRLMEPVKVLVSSESSGGFKPVFGARFTFAATPARTVTGTVRDARTGEPMAGVAVDSYKLADYVYSVHRVLKTVTDSDGRFRLVGMPKGDGNQILLLPNDDQPYFMREFNIPNPDGLEPVDVIAPRSLGKEDEM